MKRMGGILAYLQGGCYATTGRAVTYIKPLPGAVIRPTAVGNRQGLFDDN